MAFKHHAKRASKGLVILLFLGAIAASLYLAYSIVAPGRVKITVFDRAANKPLANKKVIIRSTECQPQPCEGEVLVEGRTNVFGNLKLNTKELADSFKVSVDGFKEEGPFRKNPGSLAFSHTYEDGEFFFVDIGLADMELKLTPTQ